VNVLFRPVEILVCIWRTTGFAPKIDVDMVWLFERRGKQARLEVLYIGADNYEVKFVDGDGVEHVEHFTSAADVANRQIDVAHTLSKQGWEKTVEWKL